MNECNMVQCNMVQQAAEVTTTAATAATTTTIEATVTTIAAASTTEAATTETARPCSGNEETDGENLTATTAAATPCPEVCEQTQNTGECPAGDYHLQDQNTPN